LSDAVVIRPAIRGDRNYILNSWLHNQYWSCRYFQAMPQDLFFKEYTGNITRLLSNPDAKIDVATLDSEPSLILGYLVYAGDCVFWAYVKRDYRGKGILHLMLKDKEFKYFTANTPASLDIGKHMKMTFNPFKGVT
jgi:hypothetical protein